MARTTIWVAATILMTVAAEAQELFLDPFKANDDVGAIWEPERPYALRSRVASLDHHRLFDAAAGRNPFVLNLFPDAQFEATVVDARLRSQGPSFVYATLAGGGHATLFVGRNVIRGNVRSPRGTYSIRSRGTPGRLTIVQIDSANLPSIHRSSETPPASDLVRKLDLPANHLPTVSAWSSDEEWEKDAGPDESVDMLAVYTAAAEAHEGGRAEMEATIAAEVENFNQVLANSGLDHRSIRLVVMERVDHDVSEESARSAFNYPKGASVADPTGVLDEVFELRERYAGDIVHLFHATEPAGSDASRCGRAVMYDLSLHQFAESECSLPETRGRLGLDTEECVRTVRHLLRRDTGYSHSSVSCNHYAGRLFTHEVGHVLGISHERYVDRTNGFLSLQDGVSFPVRPYGFGHVYLNHSRRTCFSSVMAYGTECGELGYARQDLGLYFSNADLEVGNEEVGFAPSGVPGTEFTEDLDGPVNAARAIDDVWDFIANIFSKTESGHTVPFMPAAGDDRRQGFVRVINHSAEAGEVTIEAFDDDGNAAELVTLEIGAHETVHFNSDDLELGNEIKGLSGGAGKGGGDWRLKLTSLLEIEALAYVRTKDGFLAAMHDLIPASGTGRRAVFLNPGSNDNQVSMLRLMNDYDQQADVRITGVDDDGVEGGEVRVVIPPFAARTFTAKELEEGSEHFEGAFGDGTGKWRLFVESQWRRQDWFEFYPPPEAHMRVMAMSLLESPTGHLTNLSTVPRNEFKGTHTVPLFPARTVQGRQGFARVVNHTEEAAEVSILAFDDNGTDYGPVTLRLDAGATAHFNSDDLEDGNDSKGLSGGIGAGYGNWRLELTSESKIDALGYVRTDDGFVTTMHDAVPSRVHSHRTAVFNPASNIDQVSSLRLINPRDQEVDITITGIDESGASLGTGVGVSLPANGARMFSAQDLESGTAGIEGSLGDGAGKWQLLIQSDHAVVAMSLLESPTGHLTNLSTAPTRGVGPWPPAGQSSASSVHP